MHASYEDGVFFGGLPVLDYRPGLSEGLDGPS